MIGVRINFQGSKAKLDFNNGLDTSIDCLAQNAVVNTVTKLGSDTVSSKKGTRLGERFFSGIVFNRQAAQHEANFAAVTSKRFVNGQLPTQSEEKLSIFELQVVGVSEDGRGWEFDAKVKSSRGAKSTVTWTIT